MPAPQTDAGRRRALDRLLQLQEAAAFTLPQEVTSAAEVASAVRSLTLPEPPAIRFMEDAAGLLVDRKTAGERVDPVALADELAVSQQRSQRLDDARRLLGIATDQAADRAVLVLTAQAGRIIEQHLQPAHQALLDQAAEHAATLAGRSLDDGWNAPPKVRTARAELVRLAERRTLLWAARDLLVGLSGQEPEHDTTGQFLVVEKPQNLHPGWKPNRPLPPLPTPDEPVERLRWLVTNMAAGPWLPLPTEQDAAWERVFGENLRRLQHADVSARANAGATV